MRASQMKIATVVAVVIIVAAAVAVYFCTKHDDQPADSYRYEYNYTYSDVDKIVKTDGSTLEKTAGGDDVKAIRVYTIAFKNDYTSSVTLSFSSIKMNTTITNPKDAPGADKQVFTASYISSFFSTSSSYSVYSGTSATVQVAFYLKDYSSHTTEKSTTTVDISFSDTINSNSKKVDSLAVSSTAVQFRSNPTTTASETSWKTVDEITLKDGSVKKAADGFTYRVYAVNVRSTGDAVTFDPSKAVLNLSVTYSEGSTTKGYTAVAEKDYKLTESVTLDAWTDNDTACKTVYVAFLCPSTGSTAVSSISSTAYMFFQGYAAGLVTGNSKLPSPSFPDSY